MPLLLDHLLRRFVDPVVSTDSDEAFTDAQQWGLQILDDRLYPHKALQLNYTTYDMRREQDYINISTSGFYLTS